MTTFDIINKELKLGWQGGTIHQAYEAFSKAERKDQDRVCSALLAITKDLSLTDLKLAQECFKIRTNHLTYKSMA